MMFDRQMVELLARRLALVEEVGHVKSQHGLPIYAPDPRSRHAGFAPPGGGKRKGCRRI